MSLCIHTWNHLGSKDSFEFFISVKKFEIDFIIMSYVAVVHIRLFNLNRLPILIGLFEDAYVHIHIQLTYKCQKLMFENI